MGPIGGSDYRYLLPQRLLLQHLSKAVPAGVVFPHCRHDYAQVDMGDMVWAVPHKQRPVMAGSELWRLPTGGPTGGAPTYTQTTQLAPQFQDVLNSRLIPQDGWHAGRPSTTQDLQNTQDALYQKQMQYLAPEQNWQ